jgi:hypothetical protein
MVRRQGSFLADLKNSAAPRQSDVQWRAAISRLPTDSWKNAITPDVWRGQTNTSAVTPRAHWQSRSRSPEGKRRSNNRDLQPRRLLEIGASGTQIRFRYAGPHTDDRLPLAGVRNLHHERRSGVLVDCPMADIGRRLVSVAARRLSLALCGRRGSRYATPLISRTPRPRRRRRRARKVTPSA